MSWSAHAREGERTPCVVVEIDLDYYDDVAVAAVNDDGSLCYRTPYTTDQDALEDLVLTTRTRRFMTHTQKPIPTLGAVPCVTSAKIQAEELKPGRGLGFFGQVSIQLSDLVDDDRREDPFYDHASRAAIQRDGKYLAKLVARNPWWTGRRIRVIEGWTTGNVWHGSDAITHHFFIRDVQGPSDDKLTITAVGPLQLLNLGEREVPSASRGLLYEAISAGATTARIDPAEYASEYPSVFPFLVRIGDEVATVTNRVGAILTMTRGSHGTIAEEHSEGDTIQVCAQWTNAPVTEILRDLLVDHGGVSESNLDLDEWAAEQASWLSLYHLSGIISKPEKLLGLVQELLDTMAAMSWWDDRSGKVRLRSIRPAIAVAGTWGDRFHLMKPPQVRRDLGERVSRCDFLIDLRSAAHDPKEASSYRLRVVGSPEGEEATKHGESRVKLVASRWLTAGELSLAVRASAQTTLMLADGRQTFQVEVSAKDAARDLGDVLDLLSVDLVDRNGSPLRTRCIVVKREAIKPGSLYRYTLERAPFGGRYAFYTAEDCPDYDDAADWQRDPGGFYANADGDDFGPDDPAYLYG
jgi:hypothetical protein